jgi:hypothetical protein
MVNLVSFCNFVVDVIKNIIRIGDENLEERLDVIGKILYTGL